MSNTQPIDDGVQKSSTDFSDWTVESLPDITSIEIDDDTLLELVSDLQKNKDY